MQGLNGKIIKTMNENIDLTKILKNCPEGFKLYSPKFGEVEFKEICVSSRYAIKTSCCLSLLSFTKKGLYYDCAGAECLLFPSAEQRDWSKFTAPWYKKEKFDPKTLQPFDKVLARDAEYATWRCTFFSHKNEGCIREYATSDNSYICCIPYNDDTKHLVGTADEAPEFYRYWEN